jgi:hypothetical protein
MRRSLLLMLVVPFVVAILFEAGLVDVGRHRWPVKTFRDRDRSRVRLEPVDTTIAALTRVARPPDSEFRGRFRIAPEEFTVYRVRARLRRVRYEPDGDVHMILVDPEAPTRSLIAEIPKPLFSIGSGFEKVFRAERALVDHHLRAHGESVEVTGIGFFDYRPHPRHGGPPNGFELHPVIQLKFLQE